ncbi:MAG: rod-binding protein [Litoreibacter sp.]|nr:rod-binding protein [Litoreibacter sp.]
MISNIPSASHSEMVQKNPKLWETAKELESVFLSEMLKHSGFGKPIEGFGSGIGEEQFSSMLADQQSRALVERNGIGLAEQIFKAIGENNEK